jgi:Protein of unknown function (DUF3761)/zinc-ribbon domain
MPPTNSCPRCGRPSSSTNSFCAYCGAPLSSTAGKGWKLLLGAVALLGGLLWASAIYTQPDTPARLTPESMPQPRAETSPTPNAQQVTRATPTPTPLPTPDSKRAGKNKEPDEVEAGGDDGKADDNSGERSSASSSSSDDYYTNSRGERVPRPRPNPGGPPAGATAQCRDGSYSFSRSRRGTCSHHGGVARWL